MQDYDQHAPYLFFLALKVKQYLKGTSTISVGWVLYTANLTSFILISWDLKYNATIFSLTYKIITWNAHLEWQENTILKTMGLLLGWGVCHWLVLKYMTLCYELVSAKHKLLCQSDTTPDKISQFSQHQASTTHLLVVNTIRLSGWFFHSM